MLRSLRVVCAAAAAFSFALPWSARADWETVKPDLVITSIKNVTGLQEYVSVAVKNVGYVGAGACRLRLQVVQDYGPTEFKYVNVPALSAGATFLKYVDMNYDVTCGVIFYGYVDIDGDVVEKYETNNSKTLDTGPCIQ
jgi:hypothetical protein